MAKNKKKTVPKAKVKTKNSPTLKPKTAIITGVTGQDGSYLAELLISKGYEVHGVERRASSMNTHRIKHLYETGKFFTHYGDLTDSFSIAALINKIQPDEFYNLGAMSHVKISFDVPKYTIETNTIGVLNALEVIRTLSPKTKFYQASSSEMFGVPGVPAPFNENTPMMPQSPYGVSKLASYHLTQQYRNGYGLFAVTGILFNHESPRRGENFVTKKISRAVARIKKGLQKELVLGNVHAKRDWGWSPEFVEAIWMMMQQEKPNVYVVATGETHTIQEFVEEAFKYVGLDWKKYVRFDDKFKRPNEVPLLLGDSSKIEKELGWKPKMKFKDIVHAMIDHDLKNL